MKNTPRGFNPKLDKDKAYSFFIELYPDDNTLNCSEVMRNLYDDAYEFAAILHDKDIDKNGEFKKPHYHIYIRFYQQYSRKRIAETYNIHLNLIEYSISRESCINYLIHNDDKDKYQYSISEILTNIEGIEKIINDKDLKLNLLVEIQDYILSQDIKTFREVAQWCRYKGKDYTYILSRNAYFIKQLM